MIDLFPYIVYTIPVAFGLSIILTVFSLPYIVHVARKHNILVYPNHRDIHKGGIPRMGGVAIFLSIVFSLVFFSGVQREAGHKAPDAVAIGELFLYKTQP